MDLTLKFPTIEDKEKWLVYVDEYSKENKENDFLNFTDKYNYELWLNNIIDEHNGVVKEGRVAASVYFLMNGQTIVGHILIRHNLNAEVLKQYGGHIKCFIKPSERKKGYGSKAVSLILEKCKYLEINKVMLTSEKDNIAGNKIILKNNGVYDSEIFIKSKNKVYNIYWLNAQNN